MDLPYDSFIYIRNIMYIILYLEIYIKERKSQNQLLLSIFNVAGMAVFIIIYVHYVI